MMDDNSLKGIKALDYLIATDSDGHTYFETVNGARVLKSTSFVAPSMVDEFGRASVWTMILNPREKLGDLLDRVPYGIIDKTITGIGATTLELTNQTRNSIIVVPTKYLAYSKFKSANENEEGSAFYVGSNIREITSSITHNEIKRYIENVSSYKKKILVVADSIDRVFEVLGEDKNNYFYMVDEIDTMQMDSNYRPKLETVIDYYFKMPETMRCVVSATLRDFSNPQLREEPIITTKYEIPERRNITLIHTNNVDAVVKAKIEDILALNSTAKILIAYNSLFGINNIINLLNISTKLLCGILCSERSEDGIEAGYLAELNDGLIDKQIVFMTCAYFAGNDILEQRHLISVSTNYKGFTLLSPGRLEQIAGRCRPGNISNTIIYDTKPIDSTIDPLSYRKILVEKANKFCLVLNTLIEIARINDVFTIFNELADSFINNYGKEKVENEVIAIIRKNSEGVYVPAFFKIDFCVERLQLHQEYYGSEDALKLHLEIRNDVTAVTNNIERTSEQEDSLRELLIDRQETVSNVLIGAKEELLQWIRNGESQVELNNLIVNALRDKQIFLKRFKQYYSYFEAEELIELLIINYDKKIFNIFSFAVVFWLASDANPFKSSIYAHFNYNPSTFQVARGVGVYSPIIIREKLRHAFRENLIPNTFEDKTLITLFNCIFKLDRSGRNYKIKGINPRNLPQPKNRIDTNNEIRDFFGEF